MLRWYDWLLKGEANGVEKEKPVKIFVMGKNEWREEDDWPLARAKNTKYYLHSSGAANGIAPSGSPSVSGQAGQAGNGTLNTVGPPGGEADHDVYDPNHAAPTIGGAAVAVGVPAGDCTPSARPAGRATRE